MLILLETKLSDFDLMFVVLLCCYCTVNQIMNFDCTFCCYRRNITNNSIMTSSIGSWDVVMRMYLYFFGTVIPVVCSVTRTSTVPHDSRNNIVVTPGIQTACSPNILSYVLVLQYIECASTSYEWNWYSMYSSRVHLQWFKFERTSTLRNSFGPLGPIYRMSCRYSPLDLKDSTG
jgi:hypothetical protein